MLLRWQCPKHLRLARKLDDGPSESPDPLSRAIGNPEGKKHIGGSSKRPPSAQSIPETQMLEAFNFACQNQDLV